ncbi:GntR family transcriptional regulator [Kitasatospora sp. NPDC059160]|uniref:GntR family transcriptional regulator n=1 Tax=Kitasatospora sp. NPDC059160 TaxID=3346748 RepID=UPI0036C31B96
MSSRYEEIAADLRRRINGGEFAAGSTLPDYDGLTSEYGVGRVTITNAIDILQAEGLVRPVKRVGLVVRIPGERRRVRRGSAIMRDPQRGYIFPAASSPGEPWVVHGRPKASDEPLPADVAEHFGVAPGTLATRRRRVTSPAGEGPFQIADAWIPEAVAAEAPQAADPVTGPGGYLDRIEEAGHGPLEWTEYTRPRLPSKDEAKLLEIPVVMPVLQVLTVGVSAKTKTAVEASVRVIPGDRVEVVSDLRRDRSARWPVEPVSPPSTAS